MRRCKCILEQIGANSLGMTWPDGQITNVPKVLLRPACQALFAKIFWLSEYSEYPIWFPSRPTKGALRNVNNAGRDAMDAEGAVDDGAGGGRKRRVGLAPRRWCLVRVKSRG